MATKKATYQYDNGTNWDEIMFKTTADQVVESSTKRFVSDTEKSNWNTAVTKANDWDNFKIGGGKIGGHVQLNKGNSFVIDGVGWIGTGYATEFEMIQTNKGKVVRLGTTDNLGNHIFMGLDGNDGVFGPSHNNLVDLGKPTNAFKDLWLGPSSKNFSGYTKLPNGMIMQWGQAGIQSGQVSNTISFPIVFPNKCLSVTCNLTGSETVNPVDCMYSVGNITASYFDIHYNKPRNEYQGLSWIAIGY